MVLLLVHVPESGDQFSFTSYAVAVETGTNQGQDVRIHVGLDDE